MRETDERAPATVISFGRTEIVTVTGNLATQPVEVLVHGANIRGMMTAGPTETIRSLGGPEVEREAMAQAPLALGSAILTGPGRLAERGVQAVIHAVVFEALGATSDLETVRRTTRAAFNLAESTPYHSLALGAIGSGHAPESLRVETVIPAIVEECVGHLRRNQSHLERIIFAARLPEAATAIIDALSQARVRLWLT